MPFLFGWSFTWIEGRDMEDANIRGESPLRTIKFRPIPRSRKTERVRPLKTIHIAPPPRRFDDAVRPIKTIHLIPPPRPGDPALV